MFKIYLDDTPLTDEPDGWASFTKQITRDVQSRTIIVSFPTDLVFYGDGWEFIYNKFGDDGYDVLIDFRAVNFDSGGNQISELLGSIIMTDVTFDMVRKTATVQVKENSYMARIWNNKTNPVAIPALLTKNDEQIIGIDPEREIAMNPTASGTIMNGNVRFGWDVYEAFKMVVANISDNDVGFTSDVLENLGGSSLLPQKMALFSGLHLRKGTTSSDGDTIVKISYEDLFRDVSRLLNLYMYPDTDSTSPKIVMCTESEWFEQQNSLDFDQPDEMEQSFFQELFYNSVRMGSTTTFSDTDVAINYPRINFASFKNEQYYFSGVNNIDNEFDLTNSSIIVDSNIINDVLVNGSNAYDDRVFMVEYNQYSGTNLGVAKGYQIAGVTVFNRELMHDKMLGRYNLASKVTENITAYDKDYRIDYENNLSDPRHSGYCDVFIPAFTTIQEADTHNSCYSTQIMQMTERQYYTIPQTDGDAQWSGTKWTAPLTGIYGFEFYVVSGMQFPLVYVSDWNLVMDVVALRKSGTTIVETKHVSSIQMGTGDESDFESSSVSLVNQSSGYTKYDNVTFWIFMNINETLEMESRVDSYVRADVNTPAYFTSTQPIAELNWTTESMKLKVLSSPQVSVDFDIPDLNPDKYRGSRIVINTALNQTDIKKLYASPQKSLIINNFVQLSETKRAWISRATINETTGAVSFELITNITDVVDSDLPLTSLRIAPPPSVECEVETLCFANENNSQYLPTI